MTMPRWLTLEQAAARVDRSMDTLRRWRRDGRITSLYGRVREADVLEVDRAMRSRAKGPRKRIRLEVVRDGVLVGTAHLNPESGKIVGEITGYDGSTLATLELRSDMPRG